MKTFKNFLDETTHVGHGHIRGLGYVTGDASASGDETLRYLNANIEDSDKRTNQIKQIHAAFHAKFFKKSHL